MSSRTRERSVGRGCGDDAVATQNPRLQSIVRAYIARFRANSEEELGSFTNARPSGRRAALIVPPRWPKGSMNWRSHGALLAQLPNEVQSAFGLTISSLSKTGRRNRQKYSRSGIGDGGELS
jgi:hypothetical protein